MTHRERLLRALNHQEPDRVPLDLASTQVTGISIIAYENFIRFMDYSEKQYEISDAIQQICIPPESILQDLAVDTRGLWPVTNHNYDFNDRDDGTYLSHIDEWGLGYRKHKKDGMWYDLYIHPLAQKQPSADLLNSYDWPAGNKRDRVKDMGKNARRFREQGYAVVCKSVCAGLLEMAIRLRGMEDCLVDLLIDEANAGLLLDKILQVKLDYWEMVLSGMGDLIDVLAEGDDFGTQTSQLISADTFRSIIKPRQAELVGFLKKKAPNAHVFFHSCGNIRDLVPDFIEMGIDIINPVHITAEGMEPRQLKKDFGKDVVFWGGGIDTQGTLPHGTPDQVKDEVRRNLDALAPDGGYVFNTIHNIQADVPPENIAAMYEAVKEFGRYT